MQRWEQGCGGAFPVIFDKLYPQFGLQVSVSTDSASDPACGGVIKTWQQFSMWEAELAYCYTSDSWMEQEKLEQKVSTVSFLTN